MLTFSESESSLPFHDLYLTSPHESRPLAPVLTSITGGRQAECPVRSSARLRTSTAVINLFLL